MATLLDFLKRDELAIQAVGTSEGAKKGWENRLSESGYKSSGTETKPFGPVSTYTDGKGNKISVDKARERYWHEGSDGKARATGTLNKMGDYLDIREGKREFSMRRR